MKKGISILLAVCMLLSCVQLTALAKIDKKADNFDLKNGGVIVEAEDMKLDKGLGVETGKSDMANGGKYIAFTTDHRKNDFAQSDAAAQFFFTPDADGVYYVWIRYAAGTESSDSIFVSMNGADFTSPLGKATTNDWEVYAWVKVGTTASIKAGEKYNIGFLGRETGFRIDQVLITNKNDTPEGRISDASNLKGEVDDMSAIFGSGMNEKAPVFEIKDGGVIFEAEDMLVVENNGGSVIESKNASGGKATKTTTSRQGTAVNMWNPAAYECYISPSSTEKADAKYNLWVRYSSSSDGDDSINLSLNGGPYTTQLNASKTGDFEVYKWMKIATITDVKPGEKYNIRILPRERGTQLDQFFVTTVGSFVPGDEPVTKLPKAGEYYIASVSTTQYPTPTITPPPEHPRLLFREKDIPTILENMEKPENAYAKAEFERLAKLEIKDKGKLPLAQEGQENIDYTLIGSIEARALKYALYGDEQAGREAIEAVINMMETIDLNNASTLERRQGYTIYISAKVYDWCYDLLTDKDKLAIVSLCQSMAGKMEIGWPPVKQGAVSGHGSEAQLLRDILSLSIAAYDEYPDMYLMAAGRILSEYIEPREYYYQSSAWHQGITYNDLRIGSSAWTDYIFWQMCGADVIKADIGEVYEKYFLYMGRPDGQRLREGDVMESQSKGSYWGLTTDKAVLIANVYKKPYLKREIMRASPDYSMIGNDPEKISAVDFLLINDPDLEPRSLRELPLTQYYGSPYGAMIARTGWEDGFSSPDVVAFMKIGEVYGANHNHLDSGNFQIYYKGILASESGTYIGYGQGHDWQYHKATIAHNSLLIYDPNEPLVSANCANTGGQRGPSGEYATMDAWLNNPNYDVHMGKVLAHEFGPDPIEPEYSYIKGDITNAYTDKVSEVFRNMLFMPTDNADYPAVFMVMDKVTASNKDFDKYWIMHSQEEPEIEGNVQTIKRTKDGYNGMLVNQTLYPKNITIDNVGGEREDEFMGVSYYSPGRFGAASNEECSTWRIDVKPTEKTETDYFLNVMYVGDADRDLAFQQAELIESNDMLGAKIMDKVALFAKNSDLLTEQTFTVPGEGEMSFVITGLAKGSYFISVDGTSIGSQIATKDGTAIYFSGPAGTYTIKNTDERATREAVKAVLPEKEIPIKIRVNTKYIYSDVDPVLQDGRTLLPMRALFENIGATVEWNAETASATATDGSTTVTVTENSNIAIVNGKEMPLDVGAQIIDGRFVVPVRFVSEALGLKVSWYEKSRLVHITGVKDLALMANYTVPANTAIVENTTCSIHVEDQSMSEPLLALNATDSNPGTQWAEDGDDRWLEVTFVNEETIDSAAIVFYQAVGRIAYFSIDVSTDGENWTRVVDHGESDGKTVDFQTFKFDPVKAKYVRYVGHRNSVSGWNSVSEIMFTRAQ